MQSASANSCLASVQPPSEHQSAEAQLSQSLSNIEALFMELEGKLVPAMAPALKTVDQQKLAPVPAASDVQIVCNLQGWARRLDGLHDQVSYVLHRLAL